MILLYNKERVSHLLLSDSISDLFNLRPRKCENVATTRGVLQIEFALRAYLPLIIFVLATPNRVRDRVIVRKVGHFPQRNFQRDSGAVWASNGGRVILNNSSYRRNTQVRVLSTGGTTIFLFFPSLDRTSKQETKSGLLRTRASNSLFDLLVSFQFERFEVMYRVILVSQHRVSRFP